MADLNPDFRSADNIIVPDSFEPGWAPDVSEDQALSQEARLNESFQNDMPTVFRAQQDGPRDPDRWASFMEFQKGKGRHGESRDWSLLDEWTFGRPYLWLPQIIGSCVCSNTFRNWVTRFMYQITILGNPERYLGKEEFGPNNISFYCPVSYGFMRRRGGLRNGDGGFCAPMGETLVKEGVLPCSTPRLLELLRNEGDYDTGKHLPEPQSKSLYRKFGNGWMLDEMKPYMAYPLLESPTVSTIEDHDRFSEECKPMFHCSMIAIKKVGTHPDGFAIHAQDHGDSWAHNMGSCGYFYASDGKKYYRWTNESWGERHIYNIPEEEVAEWYRRGRMSSRAIGRIDAPQVAPPVFI